MSHIHIVIRCCSEENTFATVMYDTYSIHGPGPALDDKDLLERVQRAVTAWRSNNATGRLYEEGDGVFDIVDLCLCQSSESLQSCLFQEGLANLKVNIYRDQPAGLWEYDTPLFEKEDNTQHRGTM